MRDVPRVAAPKVGTGQPVTRQAMAGAMKQLPALQTLNAATGATHAAAWANISPTSAIRRFFQANSLIVLEGTPQSLHYNGKAAALFSAWGRRIFGGGWEGKVSFICARRSRRSLSGSV